MKTPRKLIPYAYSSSSYMEDPGVHCGFMDIVEISGYFKKRDWVLGLYGFPVRFNGVSRVVLGVSVGPFCLQVGIERPNEEYDSCYRQPRYLVWQ